MKFKTDDKVKLKSGDSFSNGKKILTVKSVMGNTVYLRETGTWVHDNTIMLHDEEKNKAIKFYNEQLKSAKKDLDMSQIEFDCAENRLLKNKNKVNYLTNLIKMEKEE